MNRVQFLAQGIEINDVQASVLSELISDIPNDELKNFLVFRMGFIDKFKSKELITKEALFGYRKIQIENKLKEGKDVFMCVDDVKKFIETYYKNSDVGYGIAKYFDYVIIALNADGELVNKYVTTEHGNYLKLNSEESARVYNWLFENQSRIGAIKIVAYYEPEQKQIAQVTKNEVIDGKVLNLLKGGNKK